MKDIIIFLSLISLLSFSFALPHFTFNGIESFHDCSGETEKVTFTILGSLSEELGSVSLPNYKIEDMGEFQCSLSKNLEDKDPKRSHKITCTIEGSFEPKAFILKEPKVTGFDFLNEKGESTWPTDPEKKTFLIGECGEKVELDKEPLLLGGTASSGLLAGSSRENPLSTLRKNLVDQALSVLPKRAYTSKADMLTAMLNAKNQFSLSQVESAYMIYKWEYQNMQYDCYNFNRDHSKIDYTEDGTYNKGKGVCDGFAKLFVTMANNLGVEAYRVVGYSKGAGYVPGKLPEQSDHAWNAIKLNGNYYLLDVTWGIGSCNGDSYIAKLKDSYFCSKPEAFIRTHLPVEPKYQLVYPTINLQQFVDMLMVNMEFYEYGMTEVSPDLAEFETDGTIEVKFKYDPSDVKLAYIYHLYYLKSNTYVEQENACWINRLETSAVLTCHANYKGTYKLQIFGGPANLVSYPLLLEYDIYATKTAANPLGFPTTYGLYSQSDMQLIEPLYNPLYRGQAIDFKIRTTTFDNIYVINGGIYRELDSDGNGLFTGEGVYITGQEVIITTLVGNQFNFIAKYTTVLDPSLSSEPTYPQAYSAPKNVLYSPLTDTLTIGKTYTFKIKCEQATKIGVYTGGRVYYLTKSGSMFTGNVKISSGNVIVVNAVNGGLSYMYLYETSY